MTSAKIDPKNITEATTLAELCRRYRRRGSS
jgi:hypothetical protein